MDGFSLNIHTTWSGLYGKQESMNGEARHPGNEARLTEIQALVVEVINRLLASTGDDVDHAIDDALGRIGSYTGRDRAYVFLIEGAFARNSHEWCAEGIDPMIEMLQALPVAELEGLRVPLSAGQVIHAPDIEDFEPGSAEYELLQSQGIRSVLMVPMLDKGELFGLVGFDSVDRPGAFLPGEIYLLRSFADVVMSVLLRRRAEEELARERAFLQGIVSTNAAGFVVLSKEGRIIYANDAAETVLGVTRDFMMGEMYNSPKWRLTDLDGQPIRNEDEPFVVVQDTGRMVQNHRVALHCDSGLRYASINAAPITSAQGVDASVVYAVTDVTAMVKAEQAREAALDNARRANVAKSNFLAKMSHEIRTPLNGILGISDILSETATDKSTLQMIDVLRNSGTLLMGIINDLLDMTKIEADALELELVSFDLEELGRRTEEVHTLRAADKGLSLSVKIDDPVGLPRRGDPQRLAQILHNLISNALKFTSEGHVNVWISAKDNRIVRLRVEDSGIGMTPEQMQRIFDPFTQADSSISRRFGGTGLGMSIVKRLVELMQGDIVVDSAIGKGTCVTIELPLPAEPRIKMPVQTPDATPQPDSRRLPRLSILVADDNRTNQMILGVMLGKLGAAVTTADNGLSALEMFRKDTFDLLVLDISMPEMDGVTLLNAIRSEEDALERARTPAFAFTANAMTHQVESYLAAGFDDCLTKPLKRPDLEAALLRVFG